MLPKHISKVILGVSLCLSLVLMIFSILGDATVYDTDGFGSTIPITSDNDAPVINHSTIIPSNNTMANWYGGNPGDVYLVCYISDNQSDVLNVTWYNRTGGGWTQLNNQGGINSNQFIGYEWTNIPYDTNRQWSINVTDGTNYTNMTGYFNFSTPLDTSYTIYDSDDFGSTIVISDEGNTLPNISSPYPSDNATSVETTPTISIYVGDLDGDTIDIWIQENTSGDENWYTLMAWGSQSCNQTFQISYGNATNYSTDYWWRVLVWDTPGSPDVNQTFKFTTQPLILDTDTFGSTIRIESDTSYTIYDTDTFGSTIQISSGAGTPNVTSPSAYWEFYVIPKWYDVDANTYINIVDVSKVWMYRDGQPGNSYLYDVDNNTYVNFLDASTVWNNRD